MPPGINWLGDNSTKEAKLMNVVEKKQLVYGDVLVVGIDIAKKVQWARIYSPMGVDAIKPFKFHNNREGFLRLESKINEALNITGIQRIVIGMEPTGHYWKPLAYYLMERGYTVVTVNPYHVKKSKELEDNSQTKSDLKDAGTIAGLIQAGRFLHCLLPTGVYAELRNLSTARIQARKLLNSALNQLQAILDEFFPEYTGVFKKVLGMASTWVLRNCPFPQYVLSLTEEELANKLKEASSNRVGLKRAKELQNAARESIGVKEGLVGAYLKLLTIMDRVELAAAEIAQIETALEKALEETGLAEYLLSIPGIGVITASWFLAEVGDLSKFDDWRQIRKLAGLNLVENSSGMRIGSKKVSKRGRSGLRNLLYLASLVLVARNPEFKALYNHFKTRADNPLKKKQALIAISMKLIRVIFALAKNKTVYDPNKVLGDFREAQLQQAA